MPKWLILSLIVATGFIPLGAWLMNREPTPYSGKVQLPDQIATVIASTPATIDPCRVLSIARATGAGLASDPADIAAAARARGAEEAAGPDCLEFSTAAP
jgi:hypothetical protein